MVTLAIENNALVMHVEGLDKLWAFRSSLTIPLAHISGAHADPEIAHAWWKGFRLAGTNLPGVIAAGTFYQHGDSVFWDVHRPDKTIVIELHDEHYARLVVEVADPTAAVGMIQDAVSASGGGAREALGKWLG